MPLYSELKECSNCGFAIVQTEEGWVHLDVTRQAYMDCERPEGTKAVPVV